MGEYLAWAKWWVKTACATTKNLSQKNNKRNDHLEILVLVDEYKSINTAAGYNFQVITEQDYYDIHF